MRWSSAFQCFSPLKTAGSTSPAWHGFQLWPSTAWLCNAEVPLQCDSPAKGPGVLFADSCSSGLHWHYGPAMLVTGAEFRLFHSGLFSFTLSLRTVFTSALSLQSIHKPPSCLTRKQKQNKAIEKKKTFPSILSLRHSVKLISMSSSNRIIISKS